MNSSYGSKFLLGIVFAILATLVLAEDPYENAPDEPYSNPADTEVEEEEEPAKPGGYPGSPTNEECKYDELDFSDCDPFTLEKYRGRNLISGGAMCEKHLNDTQECSLGDFPPGTQWLIQEHKKCISELEHLKSLITELHRWVDLIVERGHSLFKTFEELRKHIIDIQKQIKDKHKEIHNDSVLRERLTKELDEWKEKARNLRGEADALKAKYMQLQREHETMKQELAACESNLEATKNEVSKLTEEIDQLESSNRQIKGQILDAERYKLMSEKAQQKLDKLKEATDKLIKAIEDAKRERQQCRVDLMNDSNKKAPKVDRDTHVNLDMQMWITHNQTVLTTLPTTTTPYSPPPSYQPIPKDQPTYPPSYLTSEATTTTTTTYTTSTYASTYAKSSYVPQYSTPGY